MGKPPVVKTVIAAGSGIATTHRDREDRNGDYRRADLVREAMRLAAFESARDMLSPEETKAAIDAARNKILGIDET